MSFARLFLAGSLLVSVAWAETCTVDPKPEDLTGNWVLLYWRAPESLIPQNVICLKDWGTLVDQKVIFNTTLISEKNQVIEDEDENNKSKKKDKNKSGSKNKSDKDSKNSKDNDDSSDSDSDSDSSESAENSSHPKLRGHHNKKSYEIIQQRCILDFSVKQQYKLTHGNFAGYVKFLDVNREKYFIEVYTDDKGEDYFFAFGRSLCLQDELYTILNNVWLKRLNVNRLEIRKANSHICDLNQSS